MRKSHGFTWIGAALLAVCLVALSGVRATAQASPSDPVVAEGIALHDKGAFDKAIEKYEEALARDPGNIEALYEMMYSYYAKHDFKKALELAQKGAKQKGSLRAAFLMMAGNAQDDLKNPAGAIKAYQEGIKEAPTQSLLHFNLGVTYLGQKEWKKGRLALQRDISLKPDHASGHLRLATVYQQEGFKVPALLAYVRFLTLESTGPRARFAADAVEELIGAPKQDEKGNVTINLSFSSNDSKKEEGDFGASELMLQMSRIVDEQATKTDPVAHPALPEPAATIHALTSTLRMVADTGDSKSSGFAATYYLPYFAALSKQEGLGEAAGYVIWQSKEVTGVNQWIEKNGDAVKRFDSWSRAFEWPAPRP